MKDVDWFEGVRTLTVAPGHCHLMNGNCIRSVFLPLPLGEGRGVGANSD